MKFEKVIYKMKNKILIIEDDTDINNVIAETLTKAGYLCRQAFSGTEALLYLEMENYNLAVMDLMLPGLPGEDLLAKCSERIELKTNDTRKACTVLDEMGITKYKVVDVNTIQIFERLNDSGDITMALAENGVKTMGISVKDEALEDYYLNLTGGAANV